MRQVGIIAAAGLYALENNMSKLKADHQKAKLLAEFLNGFENVNVNVDLVQTNILAFELKNINDADFIQKCKENGLLVGPMGNGIVRIVTHMDISDDDITQAKSILSKVLN
ncbi:MAG: low specificity L-threonine aldolase, partial [Melioribacteraceae bacterium]|nr:low specificity L-threonine aldolase [Melioribacteraceae bacterium]